MLKDIAALLGAAFLLTGCASTTVYQAYPGAALPPGESSVLVVPAMLDVLAIDGAAMARTMRLKTSGEQRLALLPGDHVLQVRYYDPTADESRHELYMAGPAVVRFHAAAGSVNMLRYETCLENPSLRRTPEKFRAWVGDTAPALSLPSGAQPSSAAAPAMPAPADLPTGHAKSVLLNDKAPY